MPDIFVSHATADDDVITRIHDTLEEAGLSVWVDHCDMKPPLGDYRNALHQAMIDCRQVVLVLSRNAVKRPEINGEWTFALNNRRELFPVIIDDVPQIDINPRLTVVPWINLAKDWSTGMDYLIACLRGTVPTPNAKTAEVVTIVRPITGSLDPHLTSIPMSGRDEDLKQVLGLLRKGPTSILGVGGLGKSRLAAEAILKSEDIQGAIWHRADDLSRPDNILELLRLHFKLEPTTSQPETLAPLRRNRLLVVLDNAESIAEDDPRRAEYAKLVSDLGGAGAQVLLTSRVEWSELPNGQLHHPQTLPLNAATQIVLDMTEAINTPHDLNPHAEALARAARQHPRLIEWAVNKTRKFEPAKIIRELESFKSEDLQNVLDEMIRHTLHQMVEAEGPVSEMAHKRLNVCRGGFTYEAAKALLGFDEDKLDKILTVLQEWQFVQLVVQEGKTRYVIDPLVIAAVGEDELAHITHYDYYRDLLKRHNKAQDYAGLDVESENLTAAFERALGRDPEAAYWLANESYAFLLNRGRIKLRLNWIEQTAILLKGNSDQALESAIQISVGLTYTELAAVEDSAASLRRAISAFEVALSFYTPAVVPLAYATIQNNLGIAYVRLSEIEDREGNLNQATAAFESALVYRVARDVPLEYATTQNNLGNAYAQLAETKDREANLRQAIVAYESALVYFIPQIAPLDYAAVQYNLGSTYHDLSILEDREANLRQAIVAYESALVYWTAQAAPLDYAKTKHNLGVAYGEIEDLATAVTCWREAEKYYRLMGDIRNADLMLEGIARNTRKNA